jgi:hypothetical protein
VKGEPTDSFSRPTPLQKSSFHFPKTYPRLTAKPTRRECDKKNS